MSLMAMERVFGLLEKEPDIRNKPNAKKLKNVKKEIEYKDVCFEYVAGKPVLKNVNLKVDVGQTIAFVGSSGISTGPHLHLEWWRAGKYMNPLELLHREGIKLD